MWSFFNERPWFIELEVQILMHSLAQRLISYLPLVIAFKLISSQFLYLQKGEINMIAVGIK